MTTMLAEGLFRVEDGRAILFGSRRRSTGTTKFPPERAELLDSDDDIERIELQTEGTLYTYTTQEFPPPLPYKGPRGAGHFQPYVVGFVELADGLLVESLIVGVGDGATLHIGERLVSIPQEFATEDGHTLLTYAFRPAT